MIDLAILLLRLFVGIVIVPHGAHKFQGMDEVNQKWKEDYNFPMGTVAFVAVLQVGTGLAIMLGIYTSYAAFVQVLIMIVATYVSIWKHREPFLSLPSGKGWDINLLLLGAFISLMLLGGGRWALLGG